MDYRIEVLEALGGSFARARAISATGQVVGEAMTPGGVEHGFSWQGGITSDLGTLGGQRSRAFDLNGSGQVVGWAQNESGVSKPALWSNGVPQQLPTLGGPSGAAWAINEAGLAVGNASVTSSIYRAVAWEGEAVFDLGTLGGDYSVAYDINTHGQIVGSSDDGRGDEWACLWSGNDLYCLGGLSGGTWSAARAINDRGQVILWGDTHGGANHAALWEDHDVTDLGTLGGEDSWAYGLNDSGLVVGWAELEAGNYHAFVHDGGQMADLGTLGGLFSSAYGINDDGVIVGAAQDTLAMWHAVRWVPVPEPALTGLALILLGLPASRPRRRRGTLRWLEGVPRRRHEHARLDRKARANGRPGSAETTQKERMMRTEIAAMIQRCLVGLLLASSVQGAQVDLSLEPAEVVISPGAAVRLELWARSSLAQSFDGVEAALAWDPGMLTLDGHIDPDGSYAWASSGFPPASPLNDSWDDGEALFQALAPLTGSSPQTDLMITTLEFSAATTEGATLVSILTEGDTAVAAGGDSVLGVVRGATVRVTGSGQDGDGGDSGTGGGSSGGDTGNGGSDGDGGSDGPGDDADDDAGPDGTDDDGTGEEAGDSEGDGENGDDAIVIAPPPDGNAGEDDSPAESEHEDAQNGGAFVTGPLCGSGIAQMLTIGLGGLCACTCWRRSRGQAQGRG